MKPTGVEEDLIRRRRDRLKDAVRFFHTWAGFSYDPKKETEAQGRKRCAERLASAEDHGKEHPLTFEWSIDQCTDSSDYSDKKPAWKLWVCLARNDEGRVLASLCGIDFGRDGEPWGEPYNPSVWHPGIGAWDEKPHIFAAKRGLNSSGCRTLG